MDTSTAGLVTLGATQGIVLFTTLMPERSKLYSSPPDAATKQNVRQGELIATVLTLGFSSLLAYLTKDNTPILIGAATVVTMLAAYEYTMRVQPIGGSSELS